jgi:CDGSH-type Zn-finger protein/uncharacterized Fe-S cluster protein YjdI
MNDVEAATTVRSVEELVGLLGEAAEIEHGLMCCYLYAAFGLRTDDGELPPDQLASVRAWRRAIMGVAVEEMAHLALVSNLMCALGVRPHFGRQNFPVAPGYHPADISVALAPFDRDTLDHFIFLERPEEVDEHDGVGFAPALRYRRGHQGERLTPVARDYATVGQLYAAIDTGLVELCARDGEASVLCGGDCGQVAADLIDLPGMRAITDLASARAAIQAIVEQGEGSSGRVENSHYARFLAIRAEWNGIERDDPGFRPSRPVARNPVMRRPPTPENRVFVDAPDAARVLDLANALYNQMLRCLIQAYGRSSAEPEAQADLVDAGIALMSVMTPVAQALTKLPASADHPGVNGGMTFATMRFYQPFVQGASEWRLLAGRFGELAAGMRAMTGLVPDAEALAARLRSLADKLGRRVADMRSARPEVAQLSGSAGRPPPSHDGPATSTADGGVEIARGRAVTIIFDGKRCIHARHCVLGAPDVFKANTPGTWLFPDAVDAETIVAIAHNCPSGAIQYQRHDGGREETPPPVNVASVRENGPLAFRSELVIAGAASGTRATLCRCGLSRNKPFCDGSHVEGGFIASGEPATGDLIMLVRRDGALVIEPHRNGPLSVSGGLEICAGTGRPVARTTKTKLCRCGHSADKPFCDGTHARVGFEAA